MHILRDCVYARKLWDVLVDPVHLVTFYSASLIEWGLLNLNKDLGSRFNEHWHLIWGVGIWMLWLWRNDACFNEDFQRPISPSEKVVNCWKSYVLVQNSVVSSTSGSLHSANWVPPPTDWVKCNVDGGDGENKRAGWMRWSSEKS
ncbi:hypothetical protein QN277_027605 [Acacia crassicarpa]|uniref:Uncharacterized protein n=1 Tax=Acacia crassicarpa TaxID=499986 RepID=A0AAE1MCB1_9FABA|nr:hypothetical protein QN277_027605 [Acacia crassicarpa]